MDNDILKNLCRGIASLAERLDVDDDADLINSLRIGYDAVAEAATELSDTTQQ